MGREVVDTAYFSYSFPGGDVTVPLSPYAILIGSPHSGRDYPADFNYTCQFGDLRKLEDAYVDKLCEGLEEQGAHVLTAKIPRSYVDLSRSRDCLNPEEVPGGLTTLNWRTTGNNERSLKFGTGLIFLRSKIHGFDIYAKGTEPNETAIMNRLQSWDAFHAKLSDVFGQFRNEGRVVYHIDMHSCGREGSLQKDGSRKRRADVIVHDKFGASCDPGMTEAAVKSLEAEGLNVALNAKPFKGGYMITTYGQPAQGVNSLQVEFVRDLYLDTETLEPGANFDTVKQAVLHLTESVKAFAQEHSQRSQPPETAPEPVF